jgi:succinate dehydrogenase / fumarate reductase, flavoprotein subunit
VPDFIGRKIGRLTQRFFDAHTYRRTVFYEDWTGEEIIRVLLEQVSQRKIEIIDNVYITKLLKSDDINEEGPSAAEVKGARRRYRR